MCYCVTMWFVMPDAEAAERRHTFAHGDPGHTIVEPWAGFNTPFERAPERRCINRGISPTFLLCGLSPRWGLKPCWMECTPTAPPGTTALSPWAMWGGVPSGLTPNISWAARTTP